MDSAALAPSSSAIFLSNVVEQSAKMTVKLRERTVRRDSDEFGMHSFRAQHMAEGKERRASEVENK